ncbi:Tyrosine-protein kinase Wzc [hydrothermal vent metagenome]|uniref:non-specific protein-tyrosine kinase n=1 Tax=hydrothermal vent metagenome TaxID=652676 RepID=A0A1W1CBA9_9ZZZZ
MNNNFNNIGNGKVEDFTFKDLLNILFKYKWSIIFITLLFSLLSGVYVYFKPNIYEAYSIIKVKPNIKSTSVDLINSNTLSDSKSKDVTEEITLLKTFKINKNALNKIDFKVQYFTHKLYKRVELYENIPIKIDKIKILNNKIIGKELTLIPKENGFSLKYDPPYKKKLEHKLFHKELLSIDSNITYHYGEKITNQYFTLRINKLSDFETPIQFIINGNIRDIFENLIKENLTITQLEKDTSLIRVGYQDIIPKRAELYVDILTKSFIKHSIISKNKQNTKTLKFIKKELQSIKKELTASEEQLENYQESKSFVKPSEQATLFIRKLSDIEIQISENVLKKKLIINLINFVQNNYNLDNIAPAVSKLDEGNTLRLITKLQDSQLMEEKLSTEYTDEYPQLKSLRREIQNIRKKIEFNLKSLRTNIEYQNSNLNERKNTYEEKLKTLPSQERHLVNIKRNYEVKSKMYEYLLKKEAENKIIQFSTFSNYQIIDQAYKSDKPVKNKKTLIVILSTIFGFILASILAVIRYSFNSKIRNKTDVEKLTSIPIYGSIPFLKQKKYQLKVQTDPRSPFSEGFRTLRTNLQFINKSNKATTILITSTIASEGKTTVSANLGKILEMAKYKTLLINLDIRKPTLHKFFDIDNSIGITNYLDGQYNEIEIIQHTEFGTLDIITSGPIPENPSELILSKRLPILFEKLKTMYDYIIIDTAPIGIVNDTKTIMKYTDLNLILLKESFAKKDFIHTIQDMIIQYQFKNVGIILNASKNIGGEYGYGYSYEYK